MGFRNAEELIAGLFATALQGQRIVITSADANLMSFYTGDPEEAAPGEIRVESLGAGFDALSLAILAPRSVHNPDIPRAQVAVRTDKATGSARIIVDATAVNVSGTVTFAGEVAADSGITLPQGERITRGPLSFPGLGPGWSAYGNGFEAPGYVELPDHYGALVGVAANAAPALNGTIMTLPVQMRPANAHNVICAGSSGRKASVVVDVDGRVWLQAFDAGMTWLSFGGGCRWPIAGF